MITTLHEFLAKNMVLESFHEKSLLREYWQYPWGSANAVGQIGRVLVHRPGEEMRDLRHGRYEVDAGAFVLRDPEGQIRAYSLSDRPPDVELMQEQHDALTEALRAEGATVIEVSGGRGDYINQVFMRDAGMVVPGGIILSRFALDMRYGETRSTMRTVAELGMPILGMIQGDGFVEGGSFTILDPKTAIVGRSIRVNDAGIHQLREILSWQGIELWVVDIPACLIHLDEAFLLVDMDTALIDPALLPHWFIDRIQSRGVTTISIHPDDPPMTNNCLTVAPGKVIFPASGVRTIDLLAKRGIHVIPVDVSEINKMGGGIHCSTLELNRDPVATPRHEGWASMDGASWTTHGLSH